MLIWVFAVIISILFIGPLILWFVRNVLKFMYGWESHTMNKSVVWSFIIGYSLGIILILILLFAVK